MSSEAARRVRPPFDPELEALLHAHPELSVSIRSEHIGRVREAQRVSELRISDSDMNRSGAVSSRELAIPGSDGGAELSLLVIRPTGAEGRRPGIVYLHGGGMFSGDNRTGLAPILDWIEELGVIVASVDYRLAPEHPHPTPLEDCYATLTWVAGNREALGIDDEPLIVAGASAGGGLAAGVAILARERGGPAISDQILMCPMLDDSCTFPSSRELEGEGVWDSQSNRTAWNALLGEATGGPDVPNCAAPARERDLKGLPAAYLDVGAVETFRDETIDFGTRLAQAGVSTELHVWAGAFHGFDVLAANSAVAKTARAARIDYLRRRLRGRVPA